MGKLIASALAQMKSKEFMALKRGKPEESDEEFQEKEEEEAVTWVKLYRNYESAMEKNGQ